MSKNFHFLMVLIVLTTFSTLPLQAGPRKGNNNTTTGDVSYAGTYEMSGSENAISLNMPHSSGEVGQLMLKFNLSFGPGSDAVQIDSSGRVKITGKIAYGVVRKYMGCPMENYGACLDAWSSSFEFIGYATLNIDLGTQTSAVKDGTRIFRYYNQYSGQNVGSITFDRNFDAEYITYVNGEPVKGEIVHFVKDTPVALKTMYEASLIQEGKVLTTVQVALHPSLNGVYDRSVRFIFYQGLFKVY